MRKAVRTLVALVGTIVAAAGGFSLLGLIYASVGADRHFETRGWLATLGLGLLGTILFVAGYWMRVDKAELRQLLTDQFYCPDAILAPKGEGARRTTMWRACFVWGAVFAVGYAIDGFLGLVVVGFGVFAVVEAHHTALRSSSHSSMKAENWFQLRIVWVTAIGEPGFGRASSIEIGAPHSLG